MGRTPTATHTDTHARKLTLQINSKCFSEDTTPEGAPKRFASTLNVSAGRTELGQSAFESHLSRL